MKSPAEITTLSKMDFTKTRREIVSKSMANSRSSTLATRIPKQKKLKKKTSTLLLYFILNSFNSMINPYLYYDHKKKTVYFQFNSTKKSSFLAIIYGNFQN